MKDKLKNAAEQIFCTKIGWMAITAIHFVIFFSIAPNGIAGFEKTYWATYAGASCLILLLMVAIVMCYYAVKNTLKRKQWTIFKGWHYCFHFPKIYLGKKDVFILRTTFTKSCEYLIGHPAQYSVNKLFGVSFGNHHKNSVRIGWNWETESGKINLFLYLYENSVRKEYFLATCDIDKEYSIALHLFKNDPFVIADVVHDNSPIGTLKMPYSYPKQRFGYYLFPYFGGKVPAPQKIKIKMEINPND